MQNVAQGSSSDGQKVEKVSILDLGKSSTPHSSNSSPTKSETDTFSEHQPRFMSDSSESEEDDVSEVESFVIDQTELDEEVRLEASKFLLSPEDNDHAVDPETQARLEALLEAAGIGKLSAGDGKHLSDPEVLRRLTSSVSCALDEAAAALTRMRTENQRPQPETRSLVEACSDGDVGTVKKLLTEGRSVHETTEEGESLLSLACSAGYYELAQVLLAMHANVEDRGIKGDCTPLMEAASAGHVDIVRLLIAHGADVNAQSSSGNTPLMYGCAGGFSEVVKVMLEAGANVEDHNENGHTPLMEAASAGHVAVAKVLLEHGAGINTHSNEFKESALTLACYKGHLDMVRFLLEAGADQEHKTDEMHTALMEASMDGHVEVAKLLLDSGAQVNMPTDSFESPLTLAACGGHVDLAMLLIERGANIEEVNDEGYTPLMEAAREGHEEMVALLLSQGANINAQTEETQETALTLACCGGFLEVADFLLKAGADLELGSSTPLMEAAQEGHLELVRYLLDQNANVRAQTQTGDTALTYACENGHTDVADLLLQYGSDLEHESEGGRTPLMKACRAGHLCTVKFLIQRGADVNRQSTNNDHTPLSLASAGGHLAVVELLLQHHADPFHKLKDNSTMLIEAAKGGHTSVVQLLLDYPHSIIMSGQQQPQSPHSPQPQPAASVQQPQQPPQPLQTQQTTQPQPPPPPQITQAQLAQAQAQQRQQQQQATLQQQLAAQPTLPTQPQQQSPPGPGLIEVPDAVRALPQEEVNPAAVLNMSSPPKNGNQQNAEANVAQFVVNCTADVSEPKKSLLRKNRAAVAVQENALTLAEAQQAKNVPPGEGGAALSKEESNILDKGSTGDKPETKHQQKIPLHQQLQQQFILQPQPALQPHQITAEHQKLYAELQRVEDEHAKQLKLVSSIASAMSLSKQEPSDQSNLQGGNSAPLFAPTSLGLQHPLYTRKGVVSTAGSSSSPSSSTATTTSRQQQLETPTTTACNPASVYLPPPPSTPPQTVVTSADAVSQSTAISDRPKAKPATKKEGKNARKAQIVQAVTQELAFQAAQMAQAAQQVPGALPPRHQRIPATTAAPAVNLHNLQFSNQQLDQQVLLQQQPQHQLQQQHNHHHHHHQQQGVQPGVQPSAQPLAVDEQDGKVAAGGILTPSQLIAHLQQLDPSINAATPQQLHHHVHQVLHQKPSLRTLQQMLPPGGPDAVELAGLLSDQQRCELFAAAAAAEVDGGLVDREHLASAVVDSLEALEALGLEDVANEREGMNLRLSAVGNMQPFNAPTLEEAISAMAAAQGQGDVSRVEYYAVPASTSQHPALQQLQYQQYQLTSGGLPPGSLEVITSASNAQILANRVVGTAGTTTTTTTTATSFQPQLLLQSPQLILPSSDTSSLSTTSLTAVTSATSTTSSSPAPAPTPVLAPVPSSAPVSGPSPVPASAPVPVFASAPTPLSPPVTVTATVTTAAQTTIAQPHHHGTQCSSHQVQASTQTMNAGVSAPLAGDKKVTNVSQSAPAKGKKARFQVQSRQQQQQQQPQQQPQQQQQQGLSLHDASTATTQYPTQCGQPPVSSLNVDSETESNHDTALTLACAGGHDELVELLLSRGSDIEHRDKKGFTPLILAATAGHHKVVEILIDHGADIEAQSERTKDTPLSLACSGGRYEVVDLLLTRGANKEHRNVSDYTPLSLAASGGYVNIIKLLLAHGAEINSRTGSKLGISPLMLAAMNGHTAAVKLLLDMGSDINAQIETNRNTALTLACFQGRHEVVSLLLDRKANVEHRAKTGLTPLMEAASGGYVEVGRVLLDKGADVNAPPVPSSRDTGLTIAADKGHCRFVELLLSRGAQVEVKNKKGNSPLWLAANGGHLNVVELLYNAGADIDSQDNRKVSCLMAAFRKGHIKVVKWMVHHVMQFPSDQEMTRYISTINDKELLEKCQDCVKIIRAAKDQQAAKANKNASILLEELDKEKTREESKRLAAQRRRERKKKKKQEKRKQLGNPNDMENDNDDDDAEAEEKGEESEREFSSSEVNGAVPESESTERVATESVDKEEGDSGIDANSQGSCSSSDVKAKDRRKDKKKKVNTRITTVNNNSSNSSTSNSNNKAEKENNPPQNVVTNNRITSVSTANSQIPEERPTERRNTTTATASSTATSITATTATALTSRSSAVHERQERKSKIEAKNPAPLATTNHLVFEATSRHPADREDFEATGNETYMPVSKTKKVSQLYNCGDVSRSHYEAEAVAGKASSATSPKQGGKREEGWKEVVRKSKKVSVPLNAISRVIGRGGSNINAIRAATGAQIEVEKQCKGQGERIITIKGSADATRQAHMLIAALIKDPDVDLMGMLPKPAKTTSTLWDKPLPTSMKMKAPGIPVGVKTSTAATVAPASLLGTAPCLTKLIPSPGVSPLLPSLRSAAACKLMSSYSPPVTRGTAPRLVAAAEKRAAILAASSSTKTTMSYTSAIMTAGRNAPKGSVPMTTQTFAAKLSEPTGTIIPSTSMAAVVPGKIRPVHSQPPVSAPVTPQVSTVPSPKHHRPPPTASAPPSIPAHLKAQNVLGHAHSAVITTSSVVAPASVALTSPAARSSSPAQQPAQQSASQTITSDADTSTPLTYSLFNSDTKTMWSRENEGNTNQKGMNFASVAAAGSVSATNTHSTTQYLDTTPPQVDASKAPGYRGNTTCSPVSSKPCSNTSSPPSMSSVEHSTPSPVKPPQLLTISRPTSVDVQQAPHQSQPPQPPQPSPILRPGLEIQAPELGLTLNRPLEMQHSPSGLAVQRPNKDNNQQPLASPQQPSMPMQQSTPPQMQQPPPGSQPPPPIGSGLVVQRPLMVEMQHSPSRSSSSVEMQASPQGQQGPPPQQPQGHVGNHLPSGLAVQRPSNMDMPRQMSMEMPPSGPMNHGLVVRPGNMDSMAVQRPSPMDLQQSPQQNQQQQQQRLEMPPADMNNSYGVRQVYQDGSHDTSGMYNPQDTLLSMVPGMSDALLNTAVSMSRLNPRAPDFSSSLHHTNKPPPHPPMFQSAPPYLPTMLPPIPNKFHQHPPRPGNTHNRWPFMPHGYQPDTSNFNVLSAGLNHPSENGNSPPSPNHGPGGDAPMKAPIRPIGTERHFKHHSMGGDADWLLGMQQQAQQQSQAEHKLPWAGHQMFRSNPPPYDMPPMDSSFQLGLDSQFHNGGNAAAAAAVALSALHTIPMMPPYNSGAGAGSFANDLGAHDTMKMDAPSWDGTNRLGMPELSDKQHQGWSAKWSH